jgi:hypothetical protein
MLYFLTSKPKKFYSFYFDLFLNGFMNVFVSLVCWLYDFYHDEFKFRITKEIFFLGFLKGFWKLRLDFALTSSCSKLWTTTKKILTTKYQGKSVTQKSNKGRSFPRRRNYVFVLPWTRIGINKGTFWITIVSTENRIVWFPLRIQMSMGLNCVSKISTWIV